MITPKEYQHYQDLKHRLTRMYGFIDKCIAETKATSDSLTPKIVNDKFESMQRMILGED